MRTKDEQKKEALLNATVKLVNEIGFASASVSKIAKEAGVSPSTLYVFFKNKEDLLLSTYIDIKLDISRAMLADFDESLPEDVAAIEAGLEGGEYLLETNLVARRRRRVIDREATYLERCPLLFGIQKQGVHT